MKVTAYMILVIFLMCEQALAHTWVDECNTCTGDRNGIHSCTAVLCGEFYHAIELEGIVLHGDEPEQKEHPTPNVEEYVGDTGNITTISDATFLIGEMVGLSAKNREVVLLDTIIGYPLTLKLGGVSITIDTKDDLPLNSIKVKCPEGEGYNENTKCWLIKYSDDEKQGCKRKRL